LTYGAYLGLAYSTDVVRATTTGALRSQLLGDIWYVLDAVWRTAQIVHLVAAALDATWQASQLTHQWALVIIVPHRIM